MGADLSPEEQFGPYLVYERLGVGGMATVHRALERGIDGFERVVALKRLLPHLAADASFIKSFVREAKVASLLSHVNIVQIFECGRVGAQYFISMEYVEGRDIRRILRHARKVSGPPPVHVTVGLLLQLCEALDYAHHKTDEAGHPLGLVHRDVSPSNVLVTRGGQVKMIDFGIAKAQSVQLRTQTGRVKGKLAYMAPEALSGNELDARSDVFAAGVIGHELLTARPLFATKNDYQTLMKIQRGDVMPPSTFNQSCPPELDAIILRALARDPDERFLHASELRDELQAMRRHYKLQASERDVASWLGWAFELEAPRTVAAPDPRRASRTELDGQSPRNRPSRPRRSEEEEAVEIAWGSVDDHNNGEPVVLDDVPDVTDKHLASASALGAEVRLDFDDLADDIPTPIPSHGGKLSPEVQSRALAASLLARPVARARNPTPSIPVRGQAAPVRGQAAAAAASRHPAPRTGGERSIDDGVITPNLGTGVGVHSAVAPSRRRTITRPPRTVPSGSTPPRIEPSQAPPPPGVPAAASPPPKMPARSQPLAVPDWGLGSQRRAETATIVDSPLAVLDGLDGSSNHDASASEPMPFHIDDLALAADTIPSMPAVRTTEPIVRFREPTTPPPMRTAPAPGAPPPQPQPAALQSPALQSPASQSPALQSPAPQSLAPQSPALQSPALQSPALQSPAPQSPALQSPALQSSAPQSPALQSPALQSPAPQSPAPQSRALQPPALQPVRAVPAPAQPAALLSTRAAPAPAQPAALLSTRAAPAPAQPAALLSTRAAPAAPQPAALLSTRAAPAAPQPPPSVNSHAPRLVTPATELFAEPELDSQSGVTLETAPGAEGRARVSSSVVAHPDDEPHQGGSLRRVLLVIVVLAIVASAIVLGTRYLPQDRDSPVETPQLAPPPPPSKPVGTLQLAVTPADSEVRIDGRLTPAGDIELAPGSHQIEILHDGHKGWLTSIEVTAGEIQQVRTELEPLDSAVVADALLIVTSAPPDLDVVLDGTPLASKTPIKVPLATGPHTVVLRRNGVEVWKKALDAHANAVYEFKPAIADPARRSGAQPGAPSASSPAAPSGAPPASSPPAPSGAPPASSPASPAAAPPASSPASPPAPPPASPPAPPPASSPVPTTVDSATAAPPVDHGSAPGSAPGSVPGAAPSSPPSPAPGSVPGAAPSSPPSSAPGSIPG